MEIEVQNETCNHILKYIINSKNVTIIHTFIDFFNVQQQSAIAKIGFSTLRSEPFFKIIITKFFMQKYLNRIDRSNYFLFYGEPDFQSIETNTINSLADQNYPWIKESYRQYQALLSAFRSETQYLQKQSQFQNVIESLFFDPDLPLPRMKRETIGMFCESAFQEHLSLIKFPQDELQQLWMEQPILQLKQQLEEELKIIMNNGQFQVYHATNIRFKIETIRYRGDKITHKNWRQYLIEGFKMHNLLVLLLAMCEKIVYTYQVLINNIKDPFMRFIQFQLRSSIYRNIALAIQNKFNFVMMNYSEFYQAAFVHPPTYPALHFFRPALSIWVQQMKSFHSMNENIYNYIIAKLRQENVKNYLSNKSDKLASLYSSLKEEIELNIFSQAKKQKAYQQNENKLEIESFFENNLEMYQVLAKDYLEYMVDISINEYNVHWCGHSAHVIKHYRLFQRFHQNIMDESNVFYGFVRDILQKSIPEGLQLSIFREIVKEDLQYLGLNIVKPVTLKGIVNFVNKVIKDELKSKEQYAFMGQQSIAKYRIFIDFQQKDNILSYFAGKAKITMDCPHSLAYLYNIQIDQHYQHMQLQQEGDEDSEKIEEYYMSEEEDQLDGQLE